MFSSLRLLGLLVVFSAVVAPRAATSQTDSPANSDSLASITVDLQTFGRPKADFPATIQIHSPFLDSDLTSTSDKPSTISFPNLPPGTYRISVTAPSRSPSQLDLTLSPGQTAKLSLIVDHVFPLTLSLDSTLSSNSVSSPDSAQVPSLLPASSASIVSAPPDSSSDSTPSPSPTSDSPSAWSDLPTPPPASQPQPFVAPCSVDDVIPRVSTHVQQFVESINRITATEFVNFERRNRKGKFEEESKARVNYVAVIQPIETGFLSVEEFRNGSAGMTAIPGYISATGSIALVLIFHPSHLNEFQMTCKGLTYWRNLSVYEVEFQQRTDVPNTMSEFRVGHMSYDIFLKGTAFIDPDSFQILHLDTDLLRPIPDILDFEHQSVDYGNVSFATHVDQLWLPQLASINIRFRNKEFVERHSYKDYRLFTIDTGQKISKPTLPADLNAPSPN